MKANERIRQNQKLYRHALRNPFRFPKPRELPEKTLGKLLPAVPGVPAILKSIRSELMTGKDGTGNEYDLPEEEIDWKAVRSELERRLRELPDFLPPELKVYRKIVQYRESLPKTVHFSEPTTQKLRIDVRILYKYFKRLYVFAADNLALPATQAADRFYSAAADNLKEYLRTGVEQPAPSEWVNAVYVSRVFGEKVVVAMANALADPDEAALRFRDELRRTFPHGKRPVTATDEAVAKYARMYAEGMELKDVADEYMQDLHPDLVPGTEEYKQTRKTEKGTLGREIRRFFARLDGRLSDET